MGKSIYAGYMTDQPAYNKSRLEKGDENTIFFFCDRGFCQYAQAHFSVAHTAFIPMSGSAYAHPVPFSERTYEIIFTGSYVEPKENYRKMMSIYQGEPRQKVRSIIKEMLSHPEKSLEQCMKHVFKLEGLEENQDNLQMIGNLMEGLLPLNHFARDYYRDKLIRSLLEAGLRVDVFGEGWEKFSCKDMEKFTIHAEGAFIARKAVADAKFSLNIMPGSFQDAMQERIISAMLNGAVAVTNSSKYIEENFQDGKNILIYSPRHLKELAANIKELLSSPDRAESIAEAGYELAVRQHTWYHRMEDMLHTLERVYGGTFRSDEEGKALEFYPVYSDRKRMLLEMALALEEAVSLAKDIAGWKEQNIYDIQYLMQQYTNALAPFRQEYVLLQNSSYLMEAVNQYLDTDQYQAVAELLYIQWRLQYLELLRAAKKK